MLPFFFYFLLFTPSLFAFAPIQDNAGYFSVETKIIAEKLLAETSLQVVTKANGSVVILDKSDRQLSPSQKQELYRPFQNSFPYLQRDRALLEFVSLARNVGVRQRLNQISESILEQLALWTSLFLFVLLIPFASREIISTKNTALLVILGLTFWVLGNATLFFSEATVFVRDNMSHLNIFSYIIDYWQFFGQPPSWILSKEGGLWLEVLTNNHMLLAPYKIPFYLMAVFLGLPTILAYKLAILTGISFLLLGIFLVLKILCRNPILPYFGVLIALFSGIGLGVLHQEQTLGTMFFIPWITWVWMKLPHFRYGFLLMGFLAGFALNTHYPQLLFGYSLVLGLSLWAVPPLGRLVLKNIERKKLIGAGIFLLLGALPLFYSYTKYFGELSSPFRGQTDSIQEKSFQEYSQMRGIHQSSLPPLALWNYILPDAMFTASLGWLDDKNLFVCGSLGVLLLLAAILKLPYLRFHILIIGSLLFLSTGIYTPAARIGWYFLPGASLFRQWYHFTSLANLHLLVFSVLTIDEALYQADRNLRTRLYSAVSRTALFTLLLLPNLIWGFHALVDYHEAAIGSVTYRPLDWKSPNFLDELVHQGKLPFTGVFAGIAKVQPQVLSQLYRPGILSWRIGDNLIPENGRGVTVRQEANGFRLEAKKIPRGAQSLVVLQANDQKWNVEDASKNKIMTTHALLELPLQSGKLFLISRPISFWYFLVSLCLITFLGLLVLMKWKHLESYS